ncbi:MAG: hypothetical protein KF791_13495 [Verrucomicrobiae bacterium]|nr:hypothetical protein [Verrucomicrobiae bacterium]
MKARLACLPLLAVVLWTGCQTTPAKREYVVILTSATPVSYSGTLRLDNRDQVVSGMTPATYTLSANRIACDLRQGPENGLLTAQIRMAPDLESQEFVTSALGPNTELKGSVNPDSFWSWLW